MSRVRIWIAGPRSWSNPDPIDKVLATLEGNYGIGRLLLMTGGAPGVDKLAEDLAVERGIHVFACRACWPVGRKAGPIRNSMIAQEFAPSLLIAFHYYALKGTDHRGTRSAIQHATRQGIRVVKIRVRPEVALPASASPESPLGNRAREEQGLPPKDPKAKRAKRAKQRRRERARESQDSSGT